MTHKYLEQIVNKLQPFYSYCICHPSKDFDVVLLNYCLACRRVLVVDNTFTIKTPVWEEWVFVSGS